jgi:excisionase family DNA binding protein
MKSSQPFYTVKTLAEKLAVTPTTVYRMVERKELPAYKIGKSLRFDPQEIDQFLESVRIGPGGLKD